MTGYGKQPIIAQAHIQGVKCLPLSFLPHSLYLPLGKSGQPTRFRGRSKPAHHCASESV